MRNCIPNLTVEKDKTWRRYRRSRRFVYIADGTLLQSHRWLSYFKHLLNIDERDGNRTEVNQREDAQHTIIEPFKLMEVEKQMKKMQNNKACGPDGVPTESLRLVDKIDPMLICDQMNAARKRHTNSLEDEHFDPLV